MTFNVFGISVPVFIKNSEHNELEGYFDPNNMSITVDINSKEKLQVSCHELFHAVWFRTGLMQAKIDISTQEIIVENFARAIEENFEELVKIRKMQISDNKKSRKKDK